MIHKPQSQVEIFDIRQDKTEGSILEMMKEGLKGTPKTLPTLLLYDERGLRLFEEITYLDEYYLTNAEIDALNKHADAIAEHVPNGSRVIELGSGNLRKVEILLDAFERAHKAIDYFALDLSYPELERTFRKVNSERYHYVSLNAFHGTYDDGLDWLSQEEHKDKVNVVLSLGSSIGNFDQAEAAKFLQDFAEVLSPSDLVIVGLDRTSHEERVFSAYHDSKGVTDQFYRNGLDRANAIFGSDTFKQDNWAVQGKYSHEKNAHQAFYVALHDIEVGGIRIKKGEEILFEQSNKFKEEQVDTLWRKAGLVPKVSYGDASGNHQIYVLRPSTTAFDTAPKDYAPVPVPSVREWQQLWTAWDTVTRSMIPSDELMNKPIKLRNSLIFYLGHIPTFADIHYTRATGSPSTDPKYFAGIFERGIDPDVDDPTQCHAHSEIPDEWPPLDTILMYQLHVRNRIMKSIDSGEAASDKKLARSLVLAYEHEAMHLETFLYMLLQSDRVLPPPARPTPDFAALARISELKRERNDWHHVPAAKIVVGANDPENNEPPERYFLWDNERPARAVDVHTFETQSRPISNGEYAKFLEQSCTSILPASWSINAATRNGKTDTPNGHKDPVNGAGEAGALASAGFIANKLVRTIYGQVPLKHALDWPVMASYDELVEFAKWAGGRIPTFEELKSIYHYVLIKERLAEKTPSTLVPAVNGHLSNDGVEETPPSEDLLQQAGQPASSPPNPSSLFIDLHKQNVGFKHWTPSPVTDDAGRLRGQSDAGGLWEWTSTPFSAHDGFSAMELYPGYSADFFDDKHNICLGGSWATVPRIAGRKSFVNWYQRNYPYVWCTARLVRDIA